MADPAGQNKSISRLRLRLGGVLFLRSLLRLVSGWCFAWGLAALVLRAVWGVPSWPLLWGLAGLAPVVAAAVVLAVRRTPSRAAARAVLDRASRAGGLVMAADEVDLGAWAEAAPGLTEPALAWRSRPLVVLTLAALVFLGFSFAVPQRYVGVAEARPLNTEEEAARLREQIQTLAEEAVLEDHEALALEQALEKATAEASADDPAKTWEALDHLEETVAEAAAEAAEQAYQQTESLAKAESLARALAAEADALDPAATTAAMKKLADLLEEAARDNAGLKEGAARDAASCRSGTLGREGALELASRLGLSKEAILAHLGRLVEARLLDGQALDLAEQLGLGNAQGLADFLAAAGEKGVPIEGIIDEWLEAQMGYGYGGIDRGRGDAPMVRAPPASPEGTAFQEQALPPATVADLKESRVLGVSLGAPTADPDAAPPAPGALGGAARGGGSAHTHVVLPKHKAAVRRYFEREGPGAAPAPGEGNTP
jgi:hypothetical protein